jgi:hypothetical protein
MSSTRKNGQQFGSFQALRAAALTGGVKLKAAPKITTIATPKVTINEEDRKAGLGMALENLRERKRAAKEAKTARQDSIRQFREWMWNVALPFIRDVQDAIVDPETGPELLDEPYIGREDSKEVTIGEQRDEFRAEINQYQQSDDATIALNLMVAEIVFWFSVRPMTVDDLSHEFETMVNNKILAENPNGRIKSYRGFHFGLHQQFNALEDEDKANLAAEIEKAVAEQVNRLRKEASEAAKEAQEACAKRWGELLEKHPMSVLDILNDKNGTCLVGNQNGFFLVAVDSDLLTVLDAGGGREHDLEKIKELEEEYNQAVSVSRASLKNESGQLKHHKNAPYIRVPSILPHDDYGPWVTSARTLWHAVRNACASLLPPDLQEGPPPADTGKKK